MIDWQRTLVFMTMFFWVWYHLDVNRHNKTLTDWFDWLIENIGIHRGAVVLHSSWEKMNAKDDVTESWNILCCTVEKKSDRYCHGGGCDFVQMCRLSFDVFNCFLSSSFGMSGACSHVQPATLLASFPLKVKAKHILHDCSMILPCGLSCTPVQCAWCVYALCVCVCVCMHVCVCMCGTDW